MRGRESLQVVSTKPLVSGACIAGLGKTTRDTCSRAFPAHWQLTLHLPSPSVFVNTVPPFSVPRFFLQWRSVDTTQCPEHVAHSPADSVFFRPPQRLPHMSRDTVSAHSFLPTCLRTLHAHTCTHAYTGHGPSPARHDGWPLMPLRRRRRRGAHPPRIRS